MEYLLKNAVVMMDGTMTKGDVFVRGGRVVSVGAAVSAPSAQVFDFSNNVVVLPGFVDVHVHLREPGFSYKETMETGTASAARGGYTTVCAMPNLNPVPDSLDNLKVQLSRIAEGACIDVLPYGAITVGEKGEVLADMEGMAKYVVAFSDDGRGVQSEDMMRAAMTKAKSLGKIIAAHCEDNALLHGGYIHDGSYAKAHGHRGICSESEWGQIKRDLKLVEEIGCTYHVCHISTKESVQLIREAKARGVNVTCETAPHYLILTDEDLQEDARFKMNPPIRSAEDRAALIEGIVDGTIDMIATDHAPHSAEEKGRGLEKSAMGVVGLETAFAAMYTHLVKTGIITMERLVELMHTAPCRRFGIGSELKEGGIANFTVFDLEKSYIVDPSEFKTMGRATPFTGMELFGRCLLTMKDGAIVWQEEAK